MTSLFRGTARRWLERAMITTAALATIATSRAGWHLEVPRPPSVPDPDRAARLTVAASDRPEVEIWDGGTARYLNAEPSSTPGKTEYLVPRGAQLRQIALTGRCQQGLCAGVCTPPSGAFVRVDSLAPSESWRTEVATKPTTTVLDPGAPLPIFRVVFDASRPAALHVDVDAAIAPQILGPMSGEFIVSWPAANGLSRPITVTWTARVVIEGACPGPEPCASPENEHVEIKSVSLARDLQ